MIINNLPKFKRSEFGRTSETFTNFDSLDDKIDDLYYMQYIKFGLEDVSEMLLDWFKTSKFHEKMQ